MSYIVTISIDGSIKGTGFIHGWVEITSTKTGENHFYSLNQDSGIFNSPAIFDNEINFDKTRATSQLSFMVSDENGEKMIIKGDELKTLSAQSKLTYNVIPDINNNSSYNCISAVSEILEAGGQNFLSNQYDPSQTERIINIAFLIDQAIKNNDIDKANGLMVSYDLLTRGEPIGSKKSNYLTDFSEEYKIIENNNLETLEIPIKPVGENMHPTIPWCPVPPPLPRDPLSLDVNGDGEVSTISKDRGVYFDLDNSGFAEKTAWIAPEDGLLVLDRNGNGQIDGGAELFGTETLLADGNFAANGFEALKEFDVNGDGVIDANDAVFADLRVWQDGNSDGLVQDGELKTLAELGISAINTNYRNDSAFTDSQNVEHREFGEFVRANGESVAVHTLWFDSDTVQSVPVDVHQGAAIAIADEIAALPDAVGFGNVYSLHEAMQRDGSGELQMLVQAFVAEHDAARRHDFAEKLLQAWAGTAEVNPAGRGGYVDARHVETMERFWGQEALQKNPAGRYAASVEAAYQELLGYTYAQLALQSHFKTAWNTVRFDTDGAADFSVTAAYFAARFAKGDAAAADALSDFLSVLAGITPDSSSLHDGFKAAAEAQALELPFALREAMLQALHTGDDVLEAAVQQHYADAGAGDNRLSGGNGNNAVLVDLRIWQNANSNGWRRAMR